MISSSQITALRFGFTFKQKHQKEQPGPFHVLCLHNGAAQAPGGFVYIKHNKNNVFCDFVSVVYWEKNQMAKSEMFPFKKEGRKPIDLG